MRDKGKEKIRKERKKDLGTYEKIQVKKIYFVINEPCENTFLIYPEQN